MSHVMRKVLISINEHSHQSLQLCSLTRPPSSVFSETILTVKTLKIGTPEIITIFVLQLEQLDFTVQYRVQKMQTE